MKENIHGVPKKQWAKWSKQARAVFNSLYDSMIQDPIVFLHPKAIPVRDMEHWNTTAWNAAWTAADAVDGNYIQKGELTDEAPNGFDTRT